MNDLKRRKALEILDYHSLPMFQKLERENAYRLHVMAYKTIDVFNLPYRILMDNYKKYGCYLEKYGNDAHFEDTVILSPNYPMPGYRRSDLETISGDCLRIITGPNIDEALFNKFDFKFVPESAEKRQQIEKHCAELRTWDLETPTGIAEWERQFAHFLGDADLKHYSCFDWWGTKTAEDTAETKQRIAYWKDLQKKYLKNPTAYRQEEPPYLPEYEGAYTLWKFLPDWENHDKKNH